MTDFYYDVGRGRADEEYRQLGHRIIYDQTGLSVNVAGRRASGPLMLVTRWDELEALREIAIVTELPA